MFRFVVLKFPLLLFIWIFYFIPSLLISFLFSLWFGFSSVVAFVVLKSLGFLLVGDINKFLVLGFTSLGVKVEYILIILFD